MINRILNPNEVEKVAARIAVRLAWQNLDRSERPMLEDALDKAIVWGRRLRAMGWKVLESMQKGDNTHLTDELVQSATVFAEAAGLAAEVSRKRTMDERAMVEVLGGCIPPAVVGPIR